MSQAIVNPEELRRFAQGLRRFNDELSKQLAALQSRFVALGNTWRDQEHKKFVEAFEQHLQHIQRSMEVTNEYIPFLMRKADRAEEYLRQR